MMKRFRLLFLLVSLIPGMLSAQDSNVVVDYGNPQKYVIDSIAVEGVKYVTPQRVISITGFEKGSTVTIPSSEFSDATKRIYQQRFFSRVEIVIDSLYPTRDTVRLKILLTERPRVSKWDFKGIRKGEKTDIQDRVKLKKGMELSDYTIKSSSDIIKRFFAEKGFINCKVRVEQETDTVIRNAVKVTFNIDKGLKVKVQRLNFHGNSAIKGRKLLKKMKKTNDKRFSSFFRFKSAKFIKKEYENDKNSVIEAFNEAGYRDARIAGDSVYYVAPNRVNIDINIDQGQKYYFRDIKWVGNSIYSPEQLNSVLKIGKGDIYDVVTLEKRLNGDPKQMHPDVKKMYTDNGYLFFHVTPVEMAIAGDSVDVEMRIYEGKQATFNNIIINGNSITHEKIARRALFTRPGYLYRQTDFERSLRELASMGHFDPEKVMSDGGYNLLPNINNNTVDAVYNLEEKPNSQLELSGGWGGNSFVGTLGVSFNNFSIRRIGDKTAWKPVPLGDGQTLSIRFQTNGTYYTTLQASFVEPWLFGKKPTSLSVTAYFSRQTNSYYNYYQSSYVDTGEYMETFGLGVGLGTRLKFPDNYFVLYNELTWRTYKLHNWAYTFMFDNGFSNLLSYRIALSRNSTDQQIYPRQGSDFSLGVELTPPYSLFKAKDTDFDNMDYATKYKWIEYHKWTFNGALYTKLIGDLVLKTAYNFGYLGYYNKHLGYSPFEGFLLGGDGQSGYQTYGSEYVGLRGYSNYSLTPISSTGYYAGNVYTKYTMELRYPLILQPQSTIFGLIFVEGGNAWGSINEFKPFQIKRSAGLGLRVMLPVVGMLGMDWGYGFDTPNTKDGSGGSQFHFLIGQQF